MPTSTDVPIYTTTLASSASTIDIDLSAFQGYTNLKIIASMKLLGADGIRMRLGDTSLDTGSSYSFTYVYGTGSAKGSFNGNNNTSASIGDGMSNSFGVFTWHIMNYSRNDCHKTILSKTGTPTRDVQIINNLWRNNSPIKMISMFTEGSGFAAGTTVSVYGIGTATIAAKATGGAIYSDSTYMYHVFNNTAAFVPSQNLTADILVVAGGGGGGGAWYGPTGGGGGAGGYLTFANQSLTSGTSYTCTIGGGGTATRNSSVASTNGANSQFGALTAAVGGGRGGEANFGYGNGAGGNGGSGGGAGGNGSNGSGVTGGTATSGQGYAGGAAYGSGSGGGGGGAGGSGVNGINATPANGGNGGAGLSNAISGGGATGVGQLVSGSYYLAGGGGGGADSTGTPGVGGIGGGGNGGTTTTIGAINTGGGGGGGSNTTQLNGSNGGSGVIIVRYAK